MGATEKGSAGPEANDLAAMVRRVIDENVYMVLGTADETGRPWTSPVFFAADDACRALYWISSPDVTHSRNLARRPELSIVVFDSRAAVGTGGASAVYMSGTAAEVRPGDVDHALSIYPGPASRGARAFTAGEVRPPSHLRIYRATVSDHYVLCPLAPGARCPEHDVRGDHRISVALS